MTSQPLVSIILCVRNGMPHVQEAVESVRALTYPNYELVVQDAASTDGTLEYLQQVDIPRKTIVSQPDNGIGQGFNRALQRCAGEIVGSVDADNRLKPAALEIIVREFAERPDAAVVYGGCDMIAEGGAFIHTWTAPDFDIFGLIDGSVVPPFGTSFFSRARCGAALSFDEAFEVVADFDLWLRLADRQIVRVFDILADVRAGQQSTTWTPGLYEKHCAFKLLALRRFFAGPGREALLATLHERAEAGIYLWAVDSLATIGAGQDYINRFFERATKGDLSSERFRRVVTAAHPSLPARDTDLIAKVLALGIEHLRQGQPRAALTYFELLQSWKVKAPSVDDLMAQRPWKSREEQLALCDELPQCTDDEQDRRERALADLQTALHAEIDSELLVRSQLQAEVDKRDRRINDVIAELQSEVNVRDEIISGLHDELRRPLRNLWRQVAMRFKRR